MSALTPEQREQFVCCMKRRLCTEDHYHENAVAQMLADERERIAAAIEASIHPDSHKSGYAATVATGKRLAADIARQEPTA